MGGAYLLAGLRGVGKRTLAIAFAARALCAQPQDDDACGACDQCVRVASGTHPDLRLVARDPERRDIGVDDARALTRWLALRPLMAARKVAIVIGAETLSVPAQNGLLKTLEEPPSQSIILLTATTPTLLLPTVRSRCQLLRLDPLSDTDLAAVLATHGVIGDGVAVLSARAEGSPGRALALADEPADGTRQLVLSALPRLTDHTTADLSSLAQKIGPDADTALAVVLGWYRDAIGLALGVDRTPRRTPDAAAGLHALATRLSPVRLLRALEIVCATIDDLSRNANKQLALETMLFEMRDIESGHLHG